MCDRPRHCQSGPTLHLEEEEHALRVLLIERVLGAWNVTVPVQAQQS